MGYFLQDSRVFFGLQHTLAIQSKGESIAGWQHGMHGLVQKTLSPQLAFP